MTAANSERVDAKTKAIEDALSRLGEPVAEAQAQALILMGEDHRHFFEAFRSKRKPEFTGR